ncbi:unnamed protein product [Brassica oleracea]
MASNDQAFEYAEVQATYVENAPDRLQASNVRSLRPWAPSCKMGSAIIFFGGLKHPRQPMVNGPPAPAHSARRLHPVLQVVR